MNLNKLLGTPIGNLHAGGDPRKVKQELHAGCNCGCNQCGDARDPEKVQAGGAGSGCHGPNCGRPSSGGGRSDKSSNVYKSADKQVQKVMDKLSKLPKIEKEGKSAKHQQIANVAKSFGYKQQGDGGYKNSTLYLHPKSGHMLLITPKGRFEHRQQWNLKGKLKTKEGSSPKKLAEHLKSLHKDESKGK